MSVASKNMFAILEDEDVSRPSSPTSKTTQAAPAAAATRGSQRGRAGPASKGGKYYQRGGKSAPQGETQEAGDDVAGGDASKRRFDGEGRGRGRGRGRGGDRGGDRGRGGRGRPFDRHSQTGKTDSDKKVHQGWGGDEGVTELKAEDAAATDAAAESFNAPPADAGDWGIGSDALDNWAVPPPTGDSAPPEVEKSGEREGRRGREREPEEEDNTLTLDEYLQQQKELDLVPKLESRKANEGDDSIWKDAVAVTKKDEEETAYFVGKTKNAPKVRAKKDEKVYLEIDARFERPQRGGRGRGGDRGGERGGRERGRGRGAGRGRANGNGAASILDVDDQRAFPSLA